LITIIMVTVENQGNFTVTFDVTAYYNGTAILTERWQDGESSNVFWSMGDMNRDGYIDYWDLYLIAKAFGWDGPPGKNPADINNDGRVDQTDLIIGARNYGKNIWTVLGLPRLIEDHAVVTLPHGYCAIVAFRWNTTGVIKGNYTISAHAWPVPGETNTADNVLTDGIVKVTIVGDVNGDGKVNIIDTFSVALAYGSEPGYPTWNPNYDINSDGKINLIDYFITALNYGKTDP